MRVILLLCFLLPGISYSSPGDLNSAFSGDGILYKNSNNYSTGQDIFEQSDGKLVIHATDSIEFNSLTRTSANYLFRINPDGSEDPSFGNNGKLHETLGLNSSWYVAPDDTIYHFGESGSVRYSADGQLLSGYTDSISTYGDLRYSRPLALKSGSILVPFENTNADTNKTRSSLIAINPDGAIDSSFNGGVPYYFADREHLGSLCLGPGDTIYAATSSLEGNYSVYRISLEGGQDTTFGTDGKWASPRNIRDMCLSPAGGVYLAGSGFINGDEFASHLTRVTEAGQPDTSFSDDGVEFFLEPEGSTGVFGAFCDVLSDGRPVLFANYHLHLFDRVGFAFLKFNVDGTPDMDFGNSGVSKVDLYVEEWGNSVTVTWALHVGRHGKLMGIGGSSPNYGPYAEPGFIAIAVVEGLAPSEIGSAANLQIDMSQQYPTILLDGTSTHTYSLWSADTPTGSWNKISELIGNDTAISIEDSAELKSSSFYQARED